LTDEPTSGSVFNVSFSYQLDHDHEVNAKGFAMTDSEKIKSPAPETHELAAATPNPLVFISHDSRDADLAEAFSKLLKSVSAGMIKSFRSSDKKGTDGIDFGDEWYKRLMSKLQSTSDVVCLFTERSLDRPWILYEAGVAKGKLNTLVLGVALGVPLTRVSTGPFYQFQNCDDSPGDLTKLVKQLARPIPHLELDNDVVESQVAALKATEAEILKSLASREGKKGKDAAEENPVAKLVEEMKALPSRVAEHLAETGESYKRRRMRRVDPMMIAHMMDIAAEHNDPFGILMAASAIRDEVPWLYELIMEVYRTVQSGDATVVEHELKKLHQSSEYWEHSPFMEELGIGGRDARMYTREIPRMLESFLHRTLQVKKARPRQRLRIDQP
jgi:hypothetical protein